MRLPLLLVYVVGIALSLTTWGRHPTASLLSVLAFAMFILGNVVSIASMWYVMRGGPLLSAAGTALWMQGRGYVSTALGVAGWVLILIALFARRPQSPAPWPPQAPDRGGRPYPEPYRPSGPPVQDIRK